MTLSADSIVTELTAKLIQLQALAEQVSEQDLLPVRLQEQLTALALAQQAQGSPLTQQSPPTTELHSDPPTPTTHHHASRNQPASYPFSPSSFLGSPVDGFAVASRLSAVGQGPRNRLVPEVGGTGTGSGSSQPAAGRVITGFKSKSPVRLAVSPVEVEDVMALRSENSQLRAELARAGRVNEIWGKELVELRRRLGISVDELEALDGAGSDSRGPFAPSHRTSLNRRRSQRSSQPSTRSASREVGSTSSGIRIPGAVSPTSGSASLSPHSTAPHSRRLSLSSFSTSFNSASSAGIGWSSSATSPSTSFPLTIAPFPTPVASSPAVRGGPSTAVGGAAFAAVSLGRALESLVERRQAVDARSTGPDLSDEDLLPSPPDATDDPMQRLPTPRAIHFAAAMAREQDSSGDPTPLSTSPGSGFASASAEMSPRRSFVAEEGHLKRARGASLSGAEELPHRLGQDVEGKGKAKI